MSRVSAIKLVMSELPSSSTQESRDINSRMFGGVPVNKALKIAQRCVNAQDYIKFLCPHLVDGLTVRDIADKYGYAEQDVQDVLDVIGETIFDYHIKNTPPGYGHGLKLLDMLNRNTSA